MKTERLARVHSIAISAIAIIVSVMTAGCTSDHGPESDGNHRYDKDNKEEKPYLMRLSFGGDYVEQSEEPLQRASSSGSYAGINVTRRPKNDPNASPEKYAYGVFTDKNNIVIELFSGYTYDFEATVLTDKTDKLSTSTILGKGYTTPFSFNKKSVQPTLMPVGDSGKFHYNQAESESEYADPSYYLHQISSGTAFVDLSDNNNYAHPGNFAYPRVHRFYGTLKNVDPELLVSASGSKPIEIDMKYKCFGLKIDASAIPETTKLTWVDKSDKKETNNVYESLIFPAEINLSKEGTTEWEDIYSVSDLRGNDPIDFTLAFTWDRGMGTKDKFEANISVRPGIRKILKIVFDGGANTRYEGNIILNEDPIDLDDVFQKVETK